MEEKITMYIAFWATLILSTVVENTIVSIFYMGLSVISLIRYGYLIIKG